MGGSVRLAWLEDCADAKRSVADVPVSNKISGGISLRNLNFGYPGTEKRCWMSRPRRSML